MFRFPLPIYQNRVITSSLTTFSESKVDRSPRAKGRKAPSGSFISGFNQVEVFMMLLLSIVALLPSAFSFTSSSLPRTTLHPSLLVNTKAKRHTNQLHASIVEKDGLFWPSSSDNTHQHESTDEHDHEEERILGMALDSVLKVYATHSEPDYLIPWQKRHQTTSTSSGFVINVPGIGIRVMTNAHSVEYGSVVQVQRRGEDEKHEAVIEAVGNECDLALLRVDSLFPPSDESEDDGGKFALQLGPLPSLQDEVEVLGYPSGGESLCVTKGVVSRIETQEYAQAGARLLAMQIDAAINPG